MRSSTVFVAAAALALGLGGCTPTSATPRPPKTVTGAKDDLRAVLGPMLDHPHESPGQRRDGLEEQAAQGEGGEDRGGDLGDLLWSEDAGPKAPPPAISPPPPPEEKAERDERKGGERARDGEKPAPRAATASALGGKLSADQVNAVIDANFDRLSACSDDEVVVSVRATVSTEGRVIEASAIRSTPDDPRIRDCIATTFRSLEFPRVASEWPTRLSFELRVGGS